MARYDRSYGGPRGGWRGQGGEMRGRGFPPPDGPPFRSGPPHGGGGYGGMGGGEWTRGPGGFSGGGRGPGRPGFGERGPAGYYGGWDRGEYGGAYEGYGGHPGGSARDHYDGPGRGAGWGRAGGFAREPFIPDEAYRRHPEYRQHHQPREWEAHQRSYGDGEPDDDEVRDAVYRRMLADAWLDPERIEVRVEDGVATLTGEVDDFMEARYAWDDAWEADGVRGVVTHLTVRADLPHEDHGDVVVQRSGERSREEDVDPAT